MDRRYKDHKREKKTIVHKTRESLHTKLKIEQHYPT
jgi:hypothetical protein